MKCPFCNEQVKLNELVRSTYHIIGCVKCYGNRHR